MFCVKENINNEVEVRVEINDENVFCICPRCGNEVQVNLEEILKDGDLFSTQVYCDTCSKKMGDTYE